MLDLFNIAKPQNCDIQQFVGATFSGVAQSSINKKYTWVKPRGVSHVYMMLIGAGGTGSGAGVGPGGSGAVTVWYGAAQNVPDNLLITVGNRDTTVEYRGTSNTTLLTASSSNAGAGGSAMTANQFTASGFFQSVAGVVGSATATSTTPSSTTFLSSGSDGGTVDANYGYSVNNSAGSGFFQMQPIIVSAGSSGTSATAAPGIGSGANGSANCGGGPGMVLIASW